MTTVIDSTTVAVDSFADLQSVLQTSNDYTLVYLAADITMTSGIAILPSKTEVTIDGRYPADGTGTVHTLTDRDSSDAGQTLGLRGASGISMTVRNMNIVGRNYYGILYVPDTASYAGVTVSYENITYTGPQITFNPYGRTRYIDCDITIAAGYSAANEVGEVCRVEIGGTTTINHTTPSGHSMFWFRGGGAPSLTVLEGADVSLTTVYDVMYTGNPVALNVQPGARLHIDTKYGVCRSSAHRFASVLVDAGAQLVVDQETSLGYASLYCNGALTVNENAVFYMDKDTATAPALVYFPAAGGSLTLNSPREFVLYSYGQTVLYFAYGTPVEITAQQVNQWSVAAVYRTAGGFDDIPAFSWRKSTDAPVVLSMTCSTTGTANLTHNFTAEELAALPAISYLMPGLARVFSCGNLPLAVDPVTDDGHAVTGVTAPGGAVQITYAAADGSPQVLTGAADEAGRFGVETGGAIPTGGEVSVAANIPFLLSYRSTEAGDPGVLTLVGPDSLPFVIRPVATSPVMLFGREDAGWSLRVTDSRVRGGPWYLYASADGPMRGDTPGRTLPDSLVLVAGDAVEPLGAAPLLVWTGADNGGGTLVTEVRWDAAQGILMRVSTEPFYNRERYTARIVWMLSEVPLEGRE